VSWGRTGSRSTSRYRTVQTTRQRSARSSSHLHLARRDFRIAVPIGQFARNVSAVNSPPARQRRGSNPLEKYSSLTHSGAATGCEPSSAAPAPYRGKVAKRAARFGQACQGVQAARASERIRHRRAPAAATEAGLCGTPPSELRRLGSVTDQRQGMLRLTSGAGPVVYLAAGRTTKESEGTGCRMTRCGSMPAGGRCGRVSRPSSLSFPGGSSRARAVTALGVEQVRPKSDDNAWRGPALLLARVSRRRPAQTRFARKGGHSRRRCDGPTPQARASPWHERPFSASGLGL